MQSSDRQAVFLSNISHTWRYSIRMAFHEIDSFLVPAKDSDIICICMLFKINLLLVLDRIKVKA